MLYTKNMIVNCRFQNTLKNAIPSGIELVSKGTTNFAVKDNRMTAVFSGGNSIEVPFNIINDKLTDGISIFSWIFPDSIVSGSFRQIFRKEDGSNRILFSFQEYGTQLTVGMNIGGNYYETDFPIDIADYDNQWVHVGFTYDKSTGVLKQFRNGVVINTVTKSNWVYGGSANGYIGSWAGIAERFQGNIYDFQIFNKALDESDVKRVMLGMSTMDNS